MKRKLQLIAVLTLAFMLLLSGCGSGQSEKQTGDETSQGEAVLTVSGYQGEDKSYTYEDLESLGIKTYSYSGRNKENNNERQVREYSGVSLKEVLEDAGYGKEGENLKVVCSDGYAREYEADSLYDLYFYDGEKAEKGEIVEPILAMMKDGDEMGNDKTYKKEDGSPLRLVFGQTDYDSEYTKDFNMQGWAAYVERIEVSQGDE